MFQDLDEAIKEGCNYDIEAGNGQRLNKNEHSPSKKLSKFLVKATLTFMITAVAIGYFIAISRNANIFGTLQGVDIANVTPVLGKHFWPRYICIYSKNKYTIISTFRIYGYNKTSKNNHHH